MILLIISCTKICGLVAISLCHLLLHHVCCLCLIQTTWHNGISNLVSLITKTKLGLSARHYWRTGLCPWALQWRAETWLRSCEAHVHHYGDMPVLAALTDVESRGLGGVNHGVISLHPREQWPRIVPRRPGSCRQWRYGRYSDQQLLLWAATSWFDPCSSWPVRLGCSRMWVTSHEVSSAPMGKPHQRLGSGEAESFLRLRPRLGAWARRRVRLLRATYRAGLAWGRDL
jgi:hypothetical protein